MRGPLIYGSESARGQLSGFISLACAALRESRGVWLLGGNDFLHRAVGGFHTCGRLSTEASDSVQGKGVNKLGKGKKVRASLGTRSHTSGGFGPASPESPGGRRGGDRNGARGAAPRGFWLGPTVPVRLLTLCRFSPPRPQDTAQSPSTGLPATATRPRTTRRSSLTTPSSTRTPWASRARWVSRRQ